MNQVAQSANVSFAAVEAASRDLFVAADRMHNIRQKQQHHQQEITTRSEHKILECEQRKSRRQLDSLVVDWQYNAAHADQSGHELSSVSGDDDDRQRVAMTPLGADSTPPIANSPLHGSEKDDSLLLQKSILANEDDEFKQTTETSNSSSKSSMHDEDDAELGLHGTLLAADQQLTGSDDDRSSSSAPSMLPTDFRFLVRRREAGALIGKRGANIKRLRDSFASSKFSIPDTGNGPERIVCIKTDSSSQDSILFELTKLFLEKSPENDEQIELKLLIHSSHAGLLIGLGGQSIKKLRNDSKAAIKIYEMCCPLSSERVCAIKAKPPVVVEAIKLIQSIIGQNPPKGTLKPYDALHFDLSLVDKYGGYLPDELLSLSAQLSSNLDLIQLQQLNSSSGGGGGNNPLVVPFSSLPTPPPNHLIQTQLNILHSQHQHPKAAFPHFSPSLNHHQQHIRLSHHHHQQQQQHFYQRQPKHYATIWRSTDAQHRSGVAQEPQSAVVVPPSPAAQQNKSTNHHHQSFNTAANRRSFSNNLRLQRFNPYLSHYIGQQPLTYQQQSNCANLSRPVVRDGTLLVTTTQQQDHPATTVYANELANQIGYANTTTNALLHDSRRPSTSLIYNPRQQQLDHPLLNSDYQCPSNGASMAQCGLPARIGQYLGTHNGYQRSTMGSIPLQSQLNRQQQASLQTTKTAEAQSPAKQQQ